MIPGEFLTAPGNIILNDDRPAITLTVTNTGIYPIQVGSHYHFFEINVALTFNRSKAWGYRLNVPAGTVMRFAPGQSRKVVLVAYNGNWVASSFDGRLKS